MLVSMKRLLLIVLLLGGVLMAPAGSAVASETGIWRYNKHSQEPPFPLSERSTSVWASGACWSDCGSHCTWGVAACLQVDAQGHCIKLGDKCDRYCQRECRQLGGPLLPIEFPWE
jgi:hypothetical protein